MYRKCVIALAFTLGLFAFSAPDANAAFVLAIDDGANGTVQKVVVDDSAIGTATQNVGLSTDPDLSAVPGSILFAGPVGVWSVTITAALSKPAIGPARLDLSVTLVSSAAGTILIGTTDTDFTYPLGPALGSSVGGVTDGTVLVWGEKDWFDQPGGPVSGNKEFSAMFGPDAVEPDAVVSQGPFGPGSFSGDASVPDSPTAPYSMTNYIKVTHTGAGVTTLNHIVAQVPVPASLALCVSGLPMLGAFWLRRRRNTKQAA